MQTKTTTLSLLLAGLLGAAGAWAQSPLDAPTEAAPSSTADTAPRVAPEVIGTRGMRAVPTAGMTTGAYLGTGEASTMVNGQPNANPDDPVLTKDRAERRSEREFKRADARSRREQALMGQRGAAAPWQQPGGTPE